MFPPSRGPSPFGQYPNTFRQSGPFSPRFNHPTTYPPGMANRGGGGIPGLLQRFLQPSATQGATGGGVTQFLGNMQQVLQMAQSATPIVQQYGPMVKNLPMMLKMLKAFNEIDDDSDSDESNQNKEVEVKDNMEKETKKKISVKKESLNKIEGSSLKSNQTKKQGISTPKLFI